MDKAPQLPDLFEKADRIILDDFRIDFEELEIS